MKSPSAKHVAWCLSGLLPATTMAAEMVKLTNETNLNQGSAWSGGQTPGANDVMLWSSTFTKTYGPDDNMSDLGASRAVAGIKVTNVGGTRHQEGRFVGFEDSGANTLTLGAGGIDLSAATQIFYLEPRVTIGASQTWNIADANTTQRGAAFDQNEDLIFNAEVAGIPFNFGNQTVTKTGAGTAVISSGYTVGSGTLVVNEGMFVIQGGRSQATTISSNLNLQVNAGRLRLQSNSGSGGASLISSAPVTVHGGILEMRTTNAAFSFSHSGAVTLHHGSELKIAIDSSGLMTLSGNITAAGNALLSISGSGNPADGVRFTGNLLGTGNLNYRHTGSSLSDPKPRCRFSGDNSGYSGTFTLDGSAGERKLVLASSSAGSAAATWNLLAGNTLEIDGVAVQLGNLQGAGTITNSHENNLATLHVREGDFSGTISDGSSVMALAKVGTGTLILRGSGYLHSGSTTVDGGTLLVENALAGPVVVNAAGTFGGTAILGGDATIHGTLSPGASVGSMISAGTLTFAPGSDVNLEIGDWSGTSEGTDWDYLEADALAFTATPANKLTIRIGGTPAQFTETAKVITIAKSTANLAGFNTDAIAIDSAGFAGTGTWAVQQAHNTLVRLSYTPGSASPFQSWASGKGLTPSNNGLAADPDSDGLTNEVEFALDGEPLSGKPSGKVVGKVATVAGGEVLTLTLPVRSTAAFSGSTEKSLTVDGAIYRIQAGTDLAQWNLAVSEVTGSDAEAIRTNLPNLTAGWHYRTFRCPGAIGSGPCQFIRVLVE